jgi:hypothetical protein
MAQHTVYFAIVKAIKSGRLKEPFGKQEFRIACPGFGEGTYNAFLYKHREDNPGGNSELFELVSKGRFYLLRPFNYGIEPECI